MTKEQIEKVRGKVAEAKQKIAEAQDALEAAAESCKGNPMEDRLNSYYDQFEDLRFDLGSDLGAWDRALRFGTEMPESWKEVI